jgi:hypothetical protein
MMPSNGLSRKNPMLNLYATLMYPSNVLCNVFHIAGEPERGVVRMLINTLLLTTLGVIVVWVVS